MAAIKVTDNIFIIGGQFLTALRDCTSYLVKGDKPVLIDCGSGEGHGRLMKNLAGIGVGSEDIDCVIGTHGHYDHISGIDLLRQENPGIRLAMHREDSKQVETADPELTCAGWMFDTPITPQRVDLKFDLETTVNLAGRDFEIIPMPGHTPGSICIRSEIDGKTILFAGDCLGPGNEKVRSDFDQWTATLDKMLEIDFDILLPGHMLTGPSNPFFAAMMKPFSKELGKNVFRFLRKNFVEEFWKISVWQYSYGTPAMSKLCKRMLDALKL